MTGASAQADDYTAVFVVKGSDPTLVDRGLDRLLAELTSPESATGDPEHPTIADSNLAVAIEEHRSPNAEDALVLGPVLDALFTPAFLADRRIVVLRDAELLDSSQASELSSRLGESFAPNVLVLAVVGKALPAVLAKAVKARGSGDRRVARSVRKGAHTVAE